MRKFLNKPYPFNDDLKYNARTVFFISIGILAFLLLFQPIEISEYSTKEIGLLLGGIAILTFIVLSGSLIVLPSLFPKIFYNSRWNVKREIIWNLWLMLTLSAVDLLYYAKLLGVKDLGFSEIGKIILLGFVPVSVIIFINRERDHRYNLRSARDLNKKLMEGKNQQDRIVYFESDYKKDNFSIDSSLLIMIKSADNYIDIYYLEDDKVKSKLIRSSLNRAAETLIEYDFIFRSHRTYIVNINHIQEIKGNSQGYKLHFKGIEFPALVSQKYISSFQKKI